MVYRGSFGALDGRPGLGRFNRIASQWWQMWLNRVKLEVPPHPPVVTVCTTGVQLRAGIFLSFNYRCPPVVPVCSLCLHFSTCLGTQVLPVSHRYYRCALLACSLCLCFSTCLGTQVLPVSHRYYRCAQVLHSNGWILRVRVYILPLSLSTGELSTPHVI